MCAFSSLRRGCACNLTGVPVHMGGRPRGGEKTFQLLYRDRRIAWRCWKKRGPIYRFMRGMRRRLLAGVIQDHGEVRRST